MSILIELEKTTGIIENQYLLYPLIRYLKSFTCFIAPVNKADTRRWAQ